MLFKKLFFLLVFLMFSIYGFSQQADKITDIIEADLFTCGQAAYICSTFLDENTEAFTYEQSMDWVLDNGLLITDKDFSMPISVAELSGLCMKTWKIPGGLFYRLSSLNAFIHSFLITI